MILHTKVKENGKLNIAIPKHFWGETVTISIETDKESSNSLQDETEYLLSSPANIQRLKQAKQEFDNEQWLEVKNLEDLF
ncbi:MAG: hypothetical protein KAH84_02355 [Thiomargarita sp.]|nr:hypothetical protein [Thiomargarita sp.]